MKTINLLSRTLLVFAAAAALTQASGPIGIYARIDKVVLDPDTKAPDTIQIWGVFALSNPADPSTYLPPARGYLYFKLGYNSETARKEWADLKQVAGAGEIVAFGSGWNQKTRLRKADEKPKDPDPYVTNIGVQKVSGRTNSPPVRALLDYKD